MSSSALSPGTIFVLPTLEERSLQAVTQLIVARITRLFSCETNRSSIWPILSLLGLPDCSPVTQIVHPFDKQTSHPDLADHRTTQKPI